MSDGGHEDARNLAPDAAVSRSLDAAIEASRQMLCKLEHICKGLRQVGATADLAVIEASLHVERVARDKLLRLHQVAVVTTHTRKDGTAAASSCPPHRGMPQ